MEISSNYLGKHVKIDLNINNFFYDGVIKKINKDSLEMVDRNGDTIVISFSSIALIRSVSG